MNEEEHPTESRERPRAELQREIGARLAGARRERGVEVAEVARHLNLSVHYLEALESGDWDELPGEVYAIGFLRQYAGYLDLDIAGELEELKTGHVELTRPLTYPDPPIAPAKVWAVGAALFFLLLFILVNALNVDEEPPAPPPPQERAPTSPSTVAPDAEAPAATERVSPPEPAPESAAPEFASTHRYLFEAVGSEMWIQIYAPAEGEAAGALLREALLKPGERVELEYASPHLIVTCGNVAALRASVDGELVAAAGTLGEENEVRRELSIGIPRE